MFFEKDNQCNHTETQKTEVEKKNPAMIVFKFISEIISLLNR